MLGLLQQKQEEPVGRIALIEFSEGARDYGLGYDLLKQITVYYHNGGKKLLKTGQVYEYEEDVMRDLAEARIPVLDVTRDKEVPEDTLVTPPHVISQGIFEIKRLLK